MALLFTLLVKQHIAQKRNNSPMSYKGHFLFSSFIQRNSIIPHTIILFHFSAIYYEPMIQMFIYDQNIFVLKNHFAIERIEHTGALYMLGRQSLSLSYIYYLHFQFKKYDRARHGGACF